MNFKEHKRCRVCNSEKMEMYLDLGMLPLSNNLCLTAEEESDRYPLQVMLCTNCGLSQLSIVVDPKILFSNYVYRSSISQEYKEHCRKMAEDLKQEYGLTLEIFHIDAAGNDGALLCEFRDVVGNKKHLNIDPAENLAPINESKGIRMFTAFWGYDAAKHLINTHWPKADLITATNVFAHVDNVIEFLDAAKMVLSERGVLIIECPYVIDFIEKGEYDTVYFEHVSYMGAIPMNIATKKVGLTLMKAEKFPIHGGSMRYHIGFGEQQQSVLDCFESEKKFLFFSQYWRFSQKASSHIYNFFAEIRRLAKSGKKLAAFAAAAKGNTLLNCAGIGVNELMYICDDTPEKQGKFSPGTHLPIVPVSELTTNPPDYLVLLSWNFSEALMKRAKSVGYKGRFIIPIPEFKIIEND